MLVGWPGSSARVAPGQPVCQTIVALGKLHRETHGQTEGQSDVLFVCSTKVVQ